MMHNTGLFLKFIVQRGLFDKGELTSSSGAKTSLVSVGPPAGDTLFTNCTVEIDGARYVGNIGVAATSSQWLAALRENNGDNALLVLVKEDNMAAYRKDGTRFNICTIAYDSRLEQRFDALAGGSRLGECPLPLDNGDPRLVSFLTRLLTDRLERKYNEIIELYYSLGADWNETLYVHMVRMLGRGYFKDAYRNLAMRVPLRVLTRHRHSLHQMEALLLGTSGLLDVLHPDPYIISLQEQFRVLRQTYNLTPMAASSWQRDPAFPDRGNVRPVNMPALRIVFVAKLFHDHDNVFERLLLCDDTIQISALLRSGVSDYWKTHYIPGKTSSYSEKLMGDDGIDYHIINIVIPMLFAYAKQRAMDPLRDKAADLYLGIRPESNRIVTKWKSKGLTIDSAFISQACIQLTREYCEKGRCAECSLGISHIIGK